MPFATIPSAIPFVLKPVGDHRSLIVAKLTFNLENDRFQIAQTQEPIEDKPSAEGGRLLRPSDVPTAKEVAELFVIGTPNRGVRTVSVSLGTQTERLNTNGDLAVVRFRLALNGVEPGTTLGIEGLVPGLDSALWRIPEWVLYVRGQSAKGSKPIVLRPHCLHIRTVQRVGTMTFVGSVPTNSEVQLELAVADRRLPQRPTSTDPTTLEEGSTKGDGRPIAQGRARVSAQSEQAPLAAWPAQSSRETVRSEAKGIHLLFLDGAKLDDAAAPNRKRTSEREQDRRKQALRMLDEIDHPISMADIVKAGPQSVRGQPTQLSFASTLVPQLSLVARLSAMVEYGRTLGVFDAAWDELLARVDRTCSSSLGASLPACRTYLNIVERHLALLPDSVDGPAIVATALLQARAFEERVILGRPCILLRLAGDEFDVPVYLPKEAGMMLPMLSSFQAKAIVAVHPRQDLAEVSDTALLVTALARLA